MPRPPVSHPALCMPRLVMMLLLLLPVYNVIVVHVLYGTGGLMEHAACLVFAKVGVMDEIVLCWNHNQHQHVRVWRSTCYDPGHVAAYHQVTTSHELSHHVGVCAASIGVNNVHNVWVSQLYRQWRMHASEK